MDLERADPPHVQGITPVVDAERARSEALLRYRFTSTKFQGPSQRGARPTLVTCLWVNGTEVTRGPGRGHWMRLHTDRFDVAPYLQPGDNVIAVAARHYGRANPWWMPAVATYGLGARRIRLRGTPRVRLVGQQRVLALALEQGMDDRGGSRHQRPTRRAARHRVCYPAVGRRRSSTTPIGAAAVELSTNHVGWPGHHHPPSSPYGALTASPLPPLRGRSVEGRAIARATVVDDGATRRPIQLRTSPPTSGTSNAGTDASPWPFTVPCRAGRAEIVMVDLGEETAGHLQLELEAAEGTMVDASRRRGTRRRRQSGSARPTQRLPVRRARQ